MFVGSPQLTTTALPVEKRTTAMESKSQKEQQHLPKSICERHTNSLGSLERKASRHNGHSTVINNFLKLLMLHRK